MPDRNITFEIREHLGTIAKYDTNWRRELNIISWNGGTPKFDIRDWDEGHVKMSKGITLSMWEMRKLVDLYVSRNNERAVARGRAIEEERNALRAASFKRRDTSGFDDASAEEPFETAETEETEETVEAQIEMPEESGVDVESTSTVTSEQESSVELDTATAERNYDDADHADETKKEEDPF